MKQIKRLKRGKISLFLAAAVLSLGILSGCGAESKEAKEARMTGIEQLNAGNYQDAIDSFGKALDESDGIVNSFELDVLKYRGEAEYKLADYKAAAQTYGILGGGRRRKSGIPLIIKWHRRQQPDRAEDAEKVLQAAEEKAKNSKKSSAEAPGVSLAFTALASAARDAGDSELAAQYCNQAIERGVSGPEIYNQLAISEMEAGDYESAMSHYEEAAFAGGQ